jgi:hypothetical protein
VVQPFLIRTVPPTEKDALLAAGEARPEDCAEAASEPGLFDVRLRLEDRRSVAAEIEKYRTETWRAWAEAERPRRRAIAMYQKLFELAPLADLGGLDEPFELVWGIGLTRWRMGEREIDLPLLERLVEIEIDEAGAQIRIRPRALPAAVNLRPYEELKVEGAMLAGDAARRVLAAAEADDGVSPFRSEDFEPALRACQTRLAASGGYEPDPFAHQHGPAALRTLAEACKSLLPGRAEPLVLAADPECLGRLDAAWRAALTAAELGVVKEELRRVAQSFGPSSGALGALARELIEDGVGRSDLDPEAVASLWDRVRSRIDDIARHQPELEALATIADRIAAAGAPAWAARLRNEPSGSPDDALLPPDWREAWEWAAAARYLDEVDGQSALRALAEERLEHDGTLRKDVRGSSAGQNLLCPVPHHDGQGEGCPDDVRDGPAPDR